MTKLHELSALGQAAWLDFIRRSFIASGELASYVELGLRGITSNPTIFEKAIAGSADYDTALRPLVDAGEPVEAIYDVLSIADIRAAADVLRPVYDHSDGEDGYVSLEVNPSLAHDTHRTIDEACRLFERLERPNIMIKIPATAAGIPAIREVIARGVNVNATLIFSVSQYEAVAEAYIAGLEKLSYDRKDLSRIASVASFFVSRVDSAVDGELEAIGEAELLGKIAIANAKVAYACFKEIISGERWQKLAAQGARVQRPLWASTSTKNPAYPDTLYVDELIGPDTVNTLPPATLRAFMDHGRVAGTLEQGLEQARQQLSRLSDLGIDLDGITKKLLVDGVTSFAKSFEALMTSISQKRAILLSNEVTFSASLGSYQSAVDAALLEIERDQVMKRIWDHDHTVWKPQSAEISNRLGWLHTVDVMKASLSRLEALADDVRRAGYTHALLLGMGGSSLAPEVFRKTFGVSNGYLDLAVLDSTDPGAVLAYAQQLDPTRTLFIVSTKSGGTVETLSFFKYFYNWIVDAVGQDDSGAHFIAITDPGSKLEDLAVKFNFRAVFLNDPNIGGRYSALSYFGMVPAALIGMDLGELLERAQVAVCNCDGCSLPANGNNIGARLGAVLGELAKAGRDKLSLIISPDMCTFGDWVEQLIAESTGKEGKGILPVVGESVGSPDVYANDRVFAYLRLSDDHTYDEALLAFESAGYPVVRLELKDVYDLGAQIFLWEMATAVAGYRLGINPFDQPNVESAKVGAREMVATFLKHGALPELTPALVSDGIQIYGDLQADTIEATLKKFLAKRVEGGYIAVQAYVQPTVESNASLLDLRSRLRAITRMAVTTGYGPRFLHSTGQLHKGDAGNGLFIQLTSHELQDAPIPDNAGKPESSMTFGVLKIAQALGDRQALLDAGREVITFDLGEDVLTHLARLSQALGKA